MAGLTQQHDIGRILGIKAGSNSGNSECIGRSAGASPLCPECGSNKLWRDGLRYSPFGGTIQRWLCRNCGLRFSDYDDVQRALSTFERVERIHTKAVKANRDKAINCQICVKETKNLAAEQKEMEVPRRSEVDIKGKILEYMWKLKKQAYAEATLKNYGYLLQSLANRGANIFNAESVKETIAKIESWCPGRKKNAVKAYTLFAAMEGIPWTPPKYKEPQKYPFIPTERELDDLIAGTSKKLSAFQQLLKETATRRGEAFNTKWTDVDLTNRTIRITPEKGSNPRMFHMSEALAQKLGNLPRTSERVFAYVSIEQLYKSFRRQRKRLAYKLGNPRLLNIHLHTYRHWKATMEYYRTRDIFHVMQFLGHRKIENTMLYVHLANSIFQDRDDQYVCKVAQNAQEATTLIELGFEYVTGEYDDGGKLFRKQKLLYLGT